MREDWREGEKINNYFKEKEKKVREDYKKNLFIKIILLINLICKVILL